MKRIFIALKVEPGETLLKMMTTLRDGLSQDSVKWTSPGNIHITLAFLGDTDENIIKQITSMLSDKCEDSGKFELILKGAGVFRSLDDPRIIWTGLGPCGKLINLNKVIISGLKDLNIRVEDRPFNPHLTLGRIKHIYHIEKLRGLIDQFQNYELQIVPVNEVILYESVLLQSGPVYTSLARINL